MRPTISTRPSSLRTYLTLRTTTPGAWQKTNSGILTLMPPQKLNAKNTGMRTRALLSHDGETVQTIIPLNRYSFFEGLSDRLLPPMQLEFEITLRDYREIIFQNDGTAWRIVVRKLEMWVPQLQLTGKGKTLANENFLQPTQWKYLKEVLHMSRHGSRMLSHRTLTSSTRSLSTVIILQD